MVSMPHVTPDILVWARETAGLTVDEAAKKLQIADARGVLASERLAALEAGQEAPKRSMLLKMAKQYRRPLLTFYLSAPPRKGDRGQDFRTLPEGHSGKADALLDALIRDVKARQEMVKAVLEDDNDIAPVPFIGSYSIADGAANLIVSIRDTIGVSLADYRAQSSPERGFALLRAGVESAGVFVLLAGNLGNYHTAIDLETFRGLALADPIAPFIVINDRDAKPAWSFTLLHELAHLWLGMTGVSGASAEARVEQFCNDVAGEYLLPATEIAGLRIDDRVDFDTAKQRIGEFAKDRLLSRSMVAYKLFRAGNISHERWGRLTGVFREEWLRRKIADQANKDESERGPNYYVVRRHRLGPALLDFVRRTLSDGSLTPTKAGKVLGVKPRSVEPLLGGVTSSRTSRAA
jgi:Zn-dependent peptidase ImmA (M78 family)/transcriptional regulator with XRE-family HTH domain